MTNGLLKMFGTLGACAILGSGCDNQTEPTRKNVIPAPANEQMSTPKPKRMFLLGIGEQTEHSKSSIRYCGMPSRDAFCVAETRFIQHGDSSGGRYFPVILYSYIPVSATNFSLEGKVYVLDEVTPNKLKFHKQ